MQDHITITAIDDRLCDFDVQVLRELNGEDTGMVGGAAMWACCTFLKGRGYAAGHYRITEKGRAYLVFLDQKDVKTDGP